MGGWVDWTVSETAVFPDPLARPWGISLSIGISKGRGEVMHLQINGWL